MGPALDSDVEGSQPPNPLTEQEESATPHGSEVDASGDMGSDILKESDDSNSEPELEQVAEVGTKRGRGRPKKDSLELPAKKQKKSGKTVGELLSRYPADLLLTQPRYQTQRSKRQYCYSPTALVLE